MVVTRTNRKTESLDDILTGETVDRTISLNLTQPVKLKKDPEFTHLLKLLSQDARQMRYDHDLKELKWALTEAISNANQYGNRQISVSYTITQKKISVTIKDNAQKPCEFDINTLMKRGMMVKESEGMTLKRTINNAYQERTQRNPTRENRGMGLFLIGYLVDYARAEYKHGQGNIIYLEKHRKA